MVRWNRWCPASQMIWRDALAPLLVINVGVVAKHMAVANDPVASIANARNVEIRKRLIWL